MNGIDQQSKPKFARFVREGNSSTNATIHSMSRDEGQRLTLNFRRNSHESFI